MYGFLIKIKSEAKINTKKTYVNHINIWFFQSKTVFEGWYNMFIWFLKNSLIATSEKSNTFSSIILSETEYG